MSPTNHDLSAVILRNVESIYPDEAGVSRMHDTRLWDSNDSVDCDLTDFIIHKHTHNR